MRIVEFHSESFQQANKWSCQSKPPSDPYSNDFHRPREPIKDATINRREEQAQSDSFDSNRNASETEPRNNSSTLSVAMLVLCSSSSDETRSDCSFSELVKKDQVFESLIPKDAVSEYKKGTCTFCIPLSHTQKNRTCIAIPHFKTAQKNKQFQEAWINFRREHSLPHSDPMLNSLKTLETALNTLKTSLHSAGLLFFLYFFCVCTILFFGYVCPQHSTSPAQGKVPKINGLMA